MPLEDKPTKTITEEFHHAVTQTTGMQGKGLLDPIALAKRPAAKGCFRVAVYLDALTFNYDPNAEGEITQDQLDLLADIKKTEAAIKEIFFPSGLPSGLRLKLPSGGIIHPKKPDLKPATTPSSGDAMKKMPEDDAPEGPSEEAARLKAIETTKGRREEATKQKFRGYFNQLAILAKVGLDGPGCQPFLAKPELSVLKDEILTREGGRVKNSYMQRLGMAAIAFGAAPFAMILVREGVILTRPDLPLLHQSIVQTFFVLCFAWVGAMVGTFLSFALRNPSVAFEQLATPEEDRLVPAMRLTYVGLLTEIFMLSLLLKILAINFGTVKTDDLVTTPTLGLLLGVFCGIAERAMGAKIVKTADTIGK